MLPGKKYTVEDAIQILRKRMWIVLVPFALVSAGTALVVRQMPDSYRSQTLLLVEPQRVPESFVRPTVTTRPIDRLQAISQEILSRTNLERIIEDFNLYAEARKTGIMEDVVDRMRRQIRVDPMRGDAFRISYVGSSARTVQQVTARLATLFIDGNVRHRENLAEGTSQFLQTQLEEARRRLIEHEKKLQAYNEKFRGQLPGQLGANLQGVQTTTMQLQQIVESVNSDRREKLAQEQALRELEDAPVPDPVPVGPTLDPSGNPVGGTATQQLAAAKVVLSGFQQRYSDIHPDVIKWKGIVRDLEPKAEAEALAKPVSEAGLSPAEAARRKKIADLRAAIDQLDGQIQKKLAEEARLRTLAANYQARVEAVPARESEMADLTRDYATFSGTYTSLLRKQEEAQLSANLERRQIGEQFRLLDPASLPGRPASPDRPMITMLGMLAGISIGLGLVVLLEYRDRSFKTDDEVSTLLNLPVLAVVPLMRSDDERARVGRRRLLTAVACAGTVVVCLGIVALTLVR